VKNTSDLPV